MIILTIRSDKPEAETGLFNDREQIAYTKWLAHLELSKTIHLKIKEILNKSSISLDDIEGIVCFKGPGSFTGLRIGLSVANALAYAQNISIVSTAGEAWIQDGISELLNGKNEKLALPKYDRPAATTPPKK
jgi:tRNA threonylcarbamoyladenosine biosynthesis protein TsaB